MSSLSFSGVPDRVPLAWGQSARLPAGASQVQVPDSNSDGKLSSIFMLAKVEPLSLVAVMVKVAVSPE